jgi:hypothetical protein
MPITLNGNGPIAGATTVNGLTLPTDSLQPALVLINSTSFSAVSTVSINNCFNATYENYRVEINTTNGSGSNNHFRLRASGVDSTANYDYFLFSRHSGNAGSDVSATGANGGYLGITSTSGATAGISLDVMRPALSQFTATNTQVAQVEASLTWAYTGSNGHRVATAYDGITFYPASGAITGTIRVYGYRNS